MLLLMVSGAILCAVGMFSAGATLVAKRFASRGGLLDRPNERSSHTRPTPRTGGLAIMAASCVAWTLGVALLHPPIESGLIVLTAGSLLAGILGFIDDAWFLEPTGKLLGQLLIALPAVLLLPMTVYGWPLWLTSAGAVVWILTYTNMFNFMDGSDGLAGGTAVLLGGFVATIALGIGRTDLVWFALALSAASAGFLRYNSAPASIFMGDAGSFFLGYSFAVLALLCIKAGARPVAVLILMHPFLLDASLTLIQRVLRRQQFWRAHRQHLYQRLLIAGLSHAAVARWYHSWQVFAGACALVYEHGNEMARVMAVATACAVAVLHVACVTWCQRRQLTREIAASEVVTIERAAQ